MTILKKGIFILILSILPQTVYLQETPDETTALKTEALKLYTQKNYSEALKIARQIVEIKEKKFGSDHIEVAKALIDVATIEVAGGNEKDGEKTMRQAIAIFATKQGLTSDDALAYARAYEIIGFVKFKDKKPEEAIAEYKHALELKEKYIGKQSLEASKTLWQIGNTYLGLGKYSEAFEAYERVVKIRSIYVEQLGYDEVLDAVQRYKCVANVSNNAMRAKSLIDNIEYNAKKYFKQTVVDGGVVNGKALKLAKPTYPEKARLVRASGSVVVQVTIDESGKIIFACAQSGHPYLYASAESAALKSKFAPTTFNGNPVKVTGIIVYNFIP